jgi:putative transposase
MSEKYKMHNPEGMYFLTMTIVHWIDLFTRSELSDVIVASIKHCQKEKGLVIYAWCIMPSHIHLILSSKQEKPSDIIRDLKKFTSKELVKTIGVINESRSEWLLNAFEKAGKRLNRITKNKVWQDGNRPKELETNHFMKQKLDYIHSNPVQARFVDEPEHYVYSSARDYTGQKGLIEVVFVQ